MAFSFEPFLAISAGHIMAVSTGPEQFDGYRDRALYSVRLIITDCTAVNIIYNQLDKRIVINCVAKKELFLGNTIILSYDEKPCSIELFVTNTDAERIANAFRTSLYYTR